MRRYIVIFCLIPFFLPTMVNAKIVFSSKRDGVKGIYVMDDDGSNVTLLTDKLNPDFPSWSPDGKQIVFARWKSLHEPIYREICLMNVDGTHIRQLTGPQKERVDFPTFSPDGSSILFIKIEKDERPNNENKKSINVLNLGNGEIVEIANVGANAPQWSPDGKQLVFSSFPRLGKSGGNIWIMDADGHDLRELLPAPLRVGQLIIGRTRPKWSPDGKKILYLESDTTFELRDGVGHIIPQGYRYFIYDLRNKKLQKLKIPKHYKFAGADWLDKGESIIFTAIPIELNKTPELALFRYNLYKYHIRTGQITRITNHPGYDYQIDWISDKILQVSPIGKKNEQWGTLKK